MGVDFHRIGIHHTIREWTWDMTTKIAALLVNKVKWPDEFDQQNTAIYCYSVDGTHLRTYEQTHPTLSKDPTWYSHKGGGAGVAYEVAVNIWKSQIVHISKKYRKASVHDKTIYQEPGGLNSKTRPGKKGIGDRGYRTKKGEPKLPVCTPNSHNTPEVRKFQGRARARGETFFGRMHNFRIIDDKFRFYDIEKHSVVVDAIVTILSYQFENGHPLFDVWITN